MRASGAALLALHQRLRAVADELLGDDAPAGHGDPAQDAGALLHALVERTSRRPDPAEVWLLLVAVSGVFPLDEEVRAARRQLELVGVDDAVLRLLEHAHVAAAAGRTSRAHLRLVRDGVVVDVDFSAKHDLQTGIQRVVRRLLPRWDRDHAVVLAVWTERATALREPVAGEQERVLRWRRPLHRLTPGPADPVLVVPWRSVLVLPEVPGTDQCLRLASLAEHSGNRVALVGYDCIPVASADLLPASEPTKFVRYLSLVKHCDVVAGISHSAVEEFRGFVDALPTQGLGGPRVLPCPLATEVVDAPEDTHDESVSLGDPRRLPEVVVVGSHEPRKNHLAVLHAAEVLWREGLQFRVRLLGGKGWSTTAFDRRLRSLRRRGRPVTAERGLDDDALWSAYRRARFTVFPSLHEGYGLPVVESLALGAPVVGTAYGSVAEIAADGGVLLVDPRDDEALTAALRHLLTDDAALDALRQAALERPVRTWDQYASDLWESTVTAVRSEVGST